MTDEPRASEPDPRDAPPLAEGLTLAALTAVLDALGASALAAIFETLGACDPPVVDAASAWLRARSREWGLRWEARRARLAAATTDDYYARMLLRREALAATREHAEAERTLARLEDQLNRALGAARAATLCRALARAQDLARSEARD
jgi:hypothetical protein